MKFMLIAGEASGDLHGGELIRALASRCPEAEFVFLGGDKMRAAAGTAPIVDYRDMAYMGFSEVIRHLGDIRRNLRLAKEALRTHRPDALILIDYPSFNLKVAKEAKKLGIKVFYYISPKVWAWKEWRVRTLKRLVDRMLVIFPFEVDWYREKHKWNVEYVGNPSVGEIDDAIAACPDAREFRRINKLPSRDIIALLPGSRRSEIRNNLRVMEAAADGFVQYRAVIAGAPGIDPDFYAQYTRLPVVYDQSVALLRNSVAALVTSGTATLEAALCGTPQVACYRANGSKLSYKIMHKLLSVNYVTLPNLIADAEVIPEKLLHLCTPEAVFEALSAIIPKNSPARLAQLDAYADIRRRLGNQPAAQRAARAILDALAQ